MTMITAGLIDGILSMVYGHGTLGAAYGVWDVKCDIWSVAHEMW